MVAGGLPVAQEEERKILEQTAGSMNSKVEPTHVKIERTKDAMAIIDLW